MQLQQHWLSTIWHMLNWIGWTKNDPKRSCSLFDHGWLPFYLLCSPSHRLLESASIADTPLHPNGNDGGRRCLNQHHHSRQMEYDECCCRQRGRLQSGGDAKKNSIRISFVGHLNRWENFSHRRKKSGAHRRNFPLFHRAQTHKGLLLVQNSVAFAVRKQVGNAT